MRDFLVIFNSLWYTQLSQASDSCFQVQVFLALSCPTVLRFAKVTPTGLLFPEGGCSVNSLLEEPRAPLIMEHHCLHPFRVDLLAPGVLGERVWTGPVGAERHRQPDQGWYLRTAGREGQTPCATPLIRVVLAGVGGRCWTHFEPRISQGWQGRGGKAARQELSFVVLQFVCEEVLVRWQELSFLVLQFLCEEVLVRWHQMS